MPMTRTVLPGFAAALMFAAFGLGAFMAPTGAEAAQCLDPQNLPQVAREMEAAINADRRRAGLRAVSLSRDLGKAAQGHACDMVRRGYFDHRDPAGNKPSDRVRRTGYKSCLTAENLAMGQKSVPEVHAGWMGSRGHRKNILDPQIADIGIGVVQPSDATRPNLYWVLVMAKPCHW
jgi:uncharacterized protein YkwD